jgi:Ni/Co efflux regulator RcnB
MIRIATAAVAAMIAFGAAPSFAASQADGSFTIAQNLDIRVGGDRDRMRDRDRDVVRERRVIREHRVRDMDRGNCRTVVVRRNTPNGTVTRRTRSCD